MSNFDQNRTLNHANKIQTLFLKILSIGTSFFCCSLTILFLLIGMMAGHRPDDWLLNDTSISFLFITAILAVFVWFFISIKLTIHGKYLYANGLIILIIFLFGLSQILHLAKIVIGI